jgi:POT family proton-dependent oligopeptide transporter
MAVTHPRGLYVLFFSEMWERFSFYGMRALLVLYLVNALDYPRADALQVYATYTGLIYLTPVLGGLIADRWLGPERAVVAGGAVMALGHFAMALPGLLYPAMGLLIVGSGLFKPNISVLVGSLYEEGDADATAASPSSTWASISAPSWRRWCAAPWGRRSAGTTDSPPRASAW